MKNLSTGLEEPYANHISNKGLDLQYIKFLDLILEFLKHNIQKYVSLPKGHKQTF